MKKLLIAAIGVCMLMTSAVHAETKNGWSVNVPSEGTAEICSEEAFEGARSLHVKDNAGEVTASHKIASTGSVKRNFRVTFYAKGSFSEDDVMVGTGTKTTASNPIAITYMPLSHEKVEKSESGGWTRYTYLFRGNVKNNDEFKFTFAPGEKDIYIDGISIAYDSAIDNESYSYVGYSILPEGGFEEKITNESGFDIGSYGWTSNIESANMSGEAAAADKISAAARVIEQKDGNRVLYIRYNPSGWVSNGLELIKATGNIGWENYYVSFKAKGAFLPNSIEIGSKYDDRLIKLAGGTGSSSENPYGENVQAEELSDGWTRYTVKTYGEGNNFRIKINASCMEMYLDDFKVWTESGTQIDLSNSSFDKLAFDKNAKFAEGWIALNTGSGAFAQRDLFLNNPSVYIESDGEAAVFYQNIENLVQGEEYTVSFDAVTFFNKMQLRVGFGSNFDKFDSASLSAMAIDNGRYSFKAKASGEKLIFASGGEIGGLWIDNVSVMDKDGQELIKNGDFSIKTQPPVYSAGEFKLLKSGTESQPGKGVYTASIDVENNFGSEDMEFTLIVCHNRGKKLIKYAEKSIRLNPNGEDEIPSTLECDIDLSDYEEGDSVEMFLWDNDIDKNSLRSFAAF